MRVPYDLHRFIHTASLCPSNQLEAFVPAFEQTLSHGSRRIKYKKHEFDDLVSLVNRCDSHDLDAPCLDGFVFSYHIPRISREFDLLKIGEDVIVDVELKSQMVPKEKLIKQMKRNAYYLSFLGKKTHVLGYYPREDEWRELMNDGLRRIAWGDAVARLSSARAYVPEDYDGIFKPSRYLVSPLADYDRFDKGEYFLSDQQEEVKNKVMTYLDLEESGGIVVTGGAGTGKSLLLFDVARSMAEQAGRPAAIFHGASLSDLHRSFNRRSRDIAILPPTELKEANLAKYCFVGFDEAHRMYPTHFEAAIERANAAEVPFLVMMDPKQKMSKREEADAVDEIARSLVPPERLFELKGKFRTNKTVAEFVDALIYGGRSRLDSAEGIEVAYARSEDEAKRQANIYCQKGYKLVAMSPSKFKHSLLDRLQPVGWPSTHGVIGLEYDRVVMIVSYVHMEGKHLCNDAYPDPNLLPTRLIYQGLTRARDAIALIVLGDWAVYQRAIELLATAYQ